jgi:hypothetical protein
VASENVAPHLASWVFRRTDAVLGILQRGYFGYFKLKWENQLLFDNALAELLRHNKKDEC